MKTIQTALAAALLGAGLAAHAAADEVSILATADATLYENSFGDTANGMGEALFIGRNNSGTVYRTLLRFDVASALPAGATIESAELTLYCNRTQAGNEPSTLHRVLADWGEGESQASGNEGAGGPASEGDATWLYTFFSPPGAGSPAWSTPGGDFDPDPSATQDVAGEFNFYTWSGEGMAADVQDWLDGAEDDYGWILIGREGGSGRSSKRFDSKDGVTPSLWPMLTVTFTTGGGGEPCTDADLAAPFGVLDLADLNAFVEAFVAQDSAADIASPAGVYDLADVQAFIASYNAGCP